MAIILMSAFASSAFNTALYASMRPTYPCQLYEAIFDYHRQSKSARWDVAVDLGCGTGQATRELKPFKRVIGVDPSAKMIQQACDTAFEIKDTSEYVQSAAEKLDFLQDHSVDLIISAQAVHWFDYSRLWPEVSRVLKPGGTAAFWGYSEFRLPKYPSLTPLIYSFLQGTDIENSLGPYWEQPGRSILNNLLRDVPSPTKELPQDFTEFQRVYYTSPYHEDVASPLPVILKKTTNWSSLLSWLNTSSSVATFQQKFPEDSTNPEGSINTRFWRTLMEEAGKFEDKKLEDRDQLEINWPLTLLLVKRL